MRILLIRHGRSVDAEANLAQRWNAPLSEGGRKEVLEKRSEYLKMPFTKIYFSPWERAKETAQILFSDSKIEMEELPYVHEHKRPEHLEGIPWEEVMKFWEKNLDNIYRPDWKPEGGESFNDLSARARKLIEKLKENSDEDLIGVVSHGNFIRHVLGNWLMKDRFNTSVYSDFLRNFSLGNLGYVQVEHKKESGETRMLSWHNW